MGCIGQRESGKQLTIQEWNIGIDNVYLSRLCSGGVFDSFKCLLGYLATLYVNKICGVFSYFVIRGREAESSFKTGMLMKQNQE